MREKILVIAAHPDDEVLGCSGTIAKKVFKEKAEVNTLIFSKGILSRDNLKNKKRKVLSNEKSAIAANKILGVNKLEILNFPDNSLDSVPRLKLIKEIEKRIKKFNPTTIYTHFHGDLNVDHQVIALSVLTACRPVKKNNIEKIYAFEVLSSTDYTYGINESFVPNHYECIDNSIKIKMKALKEYDYEMRPFPHSRSYKAILNLSKTRGSQMFKKHAEAFILIRSFSK